MWVKNRLPAMRDKMMPRMGILSRDYGPEKAPRQTVTDYLRFPQNFREIVGNPSVSKMNHLFNLIAAGRRSDCEKKPGSERGGLKWRRKWEFLAAIRVRKRGLFRRRRIVCDFPKILGKSWAIIESPNSPLLFN